MRRWRPSPERWRRPRQEDGASLTPAGSAAASQLPPLLTSSRSAATVTSTGALGRSAPLGRQSNGFTSGVRASWYAVTSEDLSAEAPELGNNSVAGAGTTREHGPPSPHRGCTEPGAACSSPAAPCSSPAARVAPSEPTR